MDTILKWIKNFCLEHGETILKWVATFVPGLGELVELIRLVSEGKSPIEIVLGLISLIAQLSGIPGLGELVDLIRSVRDGKRVVEIVWSLVAAVLTRFLTNKIVDAIFGKPSSHNKRDK